MIKQFPEKDTDLPRTFAALKDPVFLGVVVGAQGIKGEVRIKSFTDPVEKISDYKIIYGFCEEKNIFWHDHLTSVRPSKNCLVAKFSKVATRSEAELCSGMKLYVERAQLPPAEEGSFYHVDLIGLRVEDVEGQFLGTVCAVLNYGASDLLELTPAKQNPPRENTQKRKQETILIPFIQDIVLDVNFSQSLIVISPPPGLLPE